MKIKIGKTIVEVADEAVKQALEKGSELTANFDGKVFTAEDLKTTHFFSNDELSSRDRAKYDEGKDAGYDIHAKELKSITGVDVERFKEPKIFAEAFREKIIQDAKIEPDKKVQELETEKKTLQGRIQEFEDKLKETKSKFTEKERDRNFRDRLRKALDGKKTIIDPDDTIDLFSKRYEREYDEQGNVILKKDGKKLKDKSETPRQPEDVFNEFLSEKKYIKIEEGGRNGGDEPGSGSGFDAFQKRMEKEGHKEGSSAYNRALSDAIQNKEFSSSDIE